MRHALALAALSLALALSGCTGGDATGRMNLHVTDAPDAIGDFAYLNVTVTHIVLHAKGGNASDEGGLTFEPASRTFDLTKLTNGNVTTIFAGDVPAGAYGKMTLQVEDAQGVLQNGTTVPVKAPSRRLFLTMDFTVAEGQETDFLFDVQVHRLGNGDYQLQPNADGSGPGKKGGAGADDADAAGKGGK